MSGLAELMADVKAVIRCLVISSPRKISVEQLGVEYEKQEGCELPFRYLGYPSLDSFLYGISDTIYLREAYKGCPIKYYIVEPMKSEKTDHIRELVKHQVYKDPKDKNKGCGASGAQKGRNKRLPKFLPVVLRFVLHNVCEKYPPRGVLLKLLIEDFKTYMHEANGWPKGNTPLWLKPHGFNTMDELIESFTQQNLISITIRDGKEWVIPNFQKAKPEDSKALEEDVQNDSTLSKSSEAEASAFNSEPEEVIESVVGMRELLSGKLFHKDSLNYSVLVSAYMMLNLKAVIKKHPNGLWCSSLPAEYKKLVGYELDFKDLGFVSVVELARGLDGTFVCIRPDNHSDWLLFDASKTLPQNPSSPNKDEKFSSVPSYILGNIKELINASPMGVGVGQFLDSYKEKFNEDLPMMDFGFANVMKFIVHLSDLGVLKGKMVDDCLVLVDFSDGGDKSLEEEKYVKKSYPEGVMGIHDKIPLQPLPDGTGPWSKVDIIVTEVVNPSYFWYQLWNRDIQGQISAMMSGLQKFYSLRATEYAMPFGAAKIGLLCAALYPPHGIQPLWHRARIIKESSLTEVVVLFIDYGKICKVLRSDLCFLHRSFAKYNTQGLKGSLFNVRPLNYNNWILQGGGVPLWPTATTDFFVDLVENMPIVAIVGSIRKSDNFISVALIDTSTEDDKHINDILVDLKFAELGFLDAEHKAPDGGAEGYEDLISSRSFKKVLEEIKALAISSESCEDGEEPLLVFPGKKGSENLVVPIPTNLRDLMKLQCMLNDRE